MELRLRKEGIVRRRVVGGYWEGGRLAAVLSMDRPTLDALVAGMGPTETLAVEPDPAVGCVRLVHRSVRVIDFSLFKKNLVSFHQQLCPPEMMGAMGGPARTRLREGAARRRLSPARGYAPVRAITAPGSGPPTSW